MGWDSPGGGYNEARVVHCDDESLQVSSSEYVVTMVGNSRFKVLPRDWRSEVCVGDMVQYHFQDDWIDCLVRGFQNTDSNTDSNTVVVFEPVFFGYTLSLPVTSLLLRKPFTASGELLALTQSGFAFNETDDESLWPPYSPWGCQNLRHLKMSIENRFHGADSVYVLPAPPVVPDHVKLVRHSNGNLLFVLEADLGGNLPNSTSMLLSPTRHRMGTLTMPFEKKTTCDVPPGVCTFNNASDLARVHFESKDRRFAAGCLFHAADVEWRGEKKELARILSREARHVHQSWHPVSRLVWQHNMEWNSDLRSVEDLNCLVKSLDRMDEGTFDLRRLKNHLCLWQIYSRFWTLSRKLFNAVESICPFDVTLASLGPNQAVFDVAVSMEEKSLAFSEHEPSCLSDVVRIMSALTEDLPWNSETETAEEELLFDPGCISENESKTNHATSCWDADLRAYLNVRSSAKEMQRRESKHLPSLNKLMLQKTRALDRTPVYWNVMEGPVELKPRELCSEWSAKRGGVLLQPNCFAKMQSLVDLIVRDMTIMDGSAPRGNIIVTKPTLLSVWRDYLEQNCVRCHMYHGPKRVQDQTKTAVLAEYVVLTTAYCMSHWRDHSYLTQVYDLAGIEPRVVLDGYFQTPEDVIPRDVVDAVDTLSSRVWIFARQATRELFAEALVVFKVRPFFPAGNWNSQNYREELRLRKYTRHFLLSKATGRDYRWLMRELVKRIFLHGEMESYELFDRSCFIERHDCVGKLAPTHKKMLVDFERKSLKRMKVESMFRLGKLHQCLVNLYYGKLPPVHFYSQRVATGKYEVKSDVFCKTMKLRADHLNQPNLKEAAGALENLLKTGSMEAACPVCLEPLCPSSSKSNEPETPLSRSVAYGACGHALCGDCADSLQRVCLENLVSGTNDYGLGDNSVNRPKCPLCRFEWDMGNPPLLLSLDPAVKFTCGNEGVYKAPQGLEEMQEEWMRTNPTLTAMEVALRKSKKAVIVCKTKGLAAHLCRAANQRSKARAVFVSADTPLASRSNALRLFRDRKCIRRLYISANYMLGMGFPNATDFFLADPLNNTHAMNFYFMVYSSWSDVRAVQTVRVHTFDSVSPKDVYGNTLLSPVDYDVDAEKCLVLRGAFPHESQRKTGYISDMSRYYKRSLGTTPTGSSGASSSVVVPIALQVLRRNCLATVDTESDEEFADEPGDLFEDSGDVLDSLLAPALSQRASV